MKIRLLLFPLLLLSLFLSSCETSTEEEVDTQATQVDELQVERIVSLDGSLTELLYAFGLGDYIVATDITSIYPEAAEAKPKMGHVSSIQAENLLSFSPDAVLAVEGRVDVSLVNQLRGLDTDLKLYQDVSTLDAAIGRIKKMGADFGKEQKAEEIIQAIEDDLAQVEPLSYAPTVLFIYTRGGGNLQVGGSGTQVHAIIEAAKARNVAESIQGFKPLNAEALVNYAPDVILLFNIGMEATGGLDALMAVPGIAQTPAGKEGRIITLDAALLNNMGPRMGQAALQLNKLLAQFEYGKS